MAKLGFTAYHHRHPFAMCLLELRMGIDIDHFDFGIVLLADWPQRTQQVVAEVAPGAAIDGQPRPFSICRHRFP